MPRNYDKPRDVEQIQKYIVISYLDTTALSQEFYLFINKALVFLKKKGVIGLEKVLNKIVLRHYEPSFDSPNKLGIYFPALKQIQLVLQEDPTNPFGNGFPLYFNALIHEIGHALQENLHGEAQAFWTAPWVEYRFETFKNSNEFISSVIKRLFMANGDISQIHYSGLNDYLKVFCLLKTNLEEYFLSPNEFKDHLDQRLPFHENLDFTTIKDFFGNKENLKLPFNQYPKAILDKFKKSDLYTPKIETYINNLDFVTDLEVPSKLHYNEHEDFAESFRILMLTPKQIKSKQKMRLFHTLWLSGFYNRPFFKKEKLMKYLRKQ